jgi:hypothetical protein
VSAEREGPKCECGRAIEPGGGGSAAEHREVACGCGRRSDCVLEDSGWRLAASLTPEKSVPVAGFSRELKEEAGIERYWFLHPLRGEVALPVHVVFSPASHRAEVKAADLKACRFEAVGSATEARRLWIARWHKAWDPGRSRRPPVLPPRRSGRLPALARPSRRPVQSAGG